MKRKNPWIAAILNFLLYGLGYIYNGKRRIFGAGIALIGAADYIVLTSMNLPDALWNWYALAGTIFALLFAYDGFRESEEINKRRR